MKPLPPIAQPCAEGVIIASPSLAPCSSKAAPWILAATIIGSSLAFIDGSVVNLALPALQTSLNATVIDVQWIVEAYALLLAALILVGGSLGDVYGSWRWAFFINIPLAVVVLTLTIRYVPESRNVHAPRTLDWPGAALVTVGLGSLVYALIESSRV